MRICLRRFCSVEEIVKNLDVGIVDGADDFEAFGGRDVRKVFGIFFGVDIFDEELRCCSARRDRRRVSGVSMAVGRAFVPA